MKNLILGADIGGGSDDFVESVTLFEYKDSGDLHEQLREAGWDLGCYWFKKVESKEQGLRHVGYCQEYIPDEKGVEDTDSWRRSVDKSMIKYKEEDVVESKDFMLNLRDLFELNDDKLDELEEE